MQISARAFQHVKLYFDIACPNTWASIKLLEAKRPSLAVDFHPVCDFKILLKRNSELFARQKESGEIGRNERPHPLIKHELKEVPLHLQELLPDGWHETYRQAEENGCVLPQLFFTSIKEHFPELLPAAVEKVGSRLWRERLPVHKGCYLSTCAREIGMNLRDSEFVISRLSHRNYRHKLTDVSNEVVALGGSQSPFFVVESSSSNQPAVFNDMRDLPPILPQIET